uniref:Uncharacterized protein n=1 Tax=Zea mays TaxID=4577 RepID=A0A804R119_MAIZE
MPHSSSSCVVFTFQARGASEAKLWTVDGCLRDGDEPDKLPVTPTGRRQKAAAGGASGQGFCLLIQGFRGFSKNI